MKAIMQSWNNHTCGCTTKDWVIVYEDGNLLQLNWEDATKLHDIITDREEMSELQGQGDVAAVHVFFGSTVLLNGCAVSFCKVTADKCAFGDISFSSAGIAQVNGYTHNHNFNPDLEFFEGLVCGSRRMVKIADKDHAVFILGSIMISLPSDVSFEQAYEYMEERNYLLDYEGVKGVVSRMSSKSQENLGLIPTGFSLLHSHIEMDVIDKGNDTFEYDGHIFRLPVGSLIDTNMYIYEHKNERIIYAIHKESSVSCLFYYVLGE